MKLVWAFISLRDQDKYSDPILFSRKDWIGRCAFESVFAMHAHGVYVNIMKYFEIDMR